MQTSAISEQEKQEATNQGSNYTSWSKKVSEVSRSLHLNATESLILGLMERPRNQSEASMRGFGERNAIAWAPFGSWVSVMSSNQKARKSPSLNSSTTLLPECGSPTGGVELFSPNSLEFLPN
ncbi:hypothetical protein R1flu_021760 [Riccia fluitans]|uniref:Uncharacterized protein n=1 Tax=Riccia fluitans TaxID=41844 RepID=A0ABD1ZRG5_9MARC